ncbi:hypothetical protein [Vibrio sp. TBV020]|uniref:hypothetical protein n=1 Tax=Vibrio sp. TBV020 TaxID=3137398 RepID=UPI0038CDB99C
MKPKLDTLETIAQEMDLHVSELLQEEYLELEVRDSSPSYKKAGHRSKYYLFEEHQAERNGAFVAKTKRTPRKSRYCLN